MAYIKILLILILTSCHSQTSIKAGPEAPNKDKDVVLRAYSGLLRITIYADGKLRGYGSGFIVAKGYAITAAHVCMGANDYMLDYLDSTELRLLSATGEWGKAKVKVFNPATDVCLVETDIDGEPLPLGNSKELEVMDKVYILGGPVGVFPFTTIGHLSAHSTAGMGDSVENALRLSCQAYGGNSGGPVINSKGQVVGILIRGYRDYPQISFASPVENVKRLYRNYISNH